MGTAIAFAAGVAAGLIVLAGIVLVMKRREQRAAARLMAERFLPDDFTRGDWGAL